MEIKYPKIFYYITLWYRGAAYKDIDFMKDNFGGEIFYNNTVQLIESIKNNKPDLMVVFGDLKNDYLIPLKYNIPYILFEHDVMGIRTGQKEEIMRHDREKMENASAVIFTSEDHAQYYEELNKKHNWRIPYYEIIHTRPLKKDLDFEPKEKLNGLHLVYAGGTIESRRKYGLFGYRYYGEIFRKFIEAGWKVHIYSASNNSARLGEYTNIGCIVHESLPYKDLLREMSQYTAGLHGYNKIGVPEAAYNYTQICRPNKLWDYLAAGIPTIGFQGGNGMKIYDGKWGIIIDNLEPETLKAIPERLKEIKITKRMRYANVMDKDIKKFKKVIEMALEDAKKEKEKRYYVIPDKVKDATKFPNKIIVHNKGAHPVYRGGYIFAPGETTGELRVTMRTYKEIKSHVSLQIKIVE